MSARQYTYDIAVHVQGDGSVVRKRNIQQIERVDNGYYRVRLPPDRSVRPETHHVALTMIGAADQPRFGQLTSVAGNTIEVRTYNKDGNMTDAAFMLAAARL